MKRSGVTLNRKLSATGFLWARNAMVPHRPVISRVGSEVEKSLGAMLTSVVTPRLAHNALQPLVFPETENKKLTCP